MEVKKPKTLDQQWEEVSHKAGLTPRELYQLCVQVFFADTNRKKDVLERANLDFQQHQMDFQNRQMQYWGNVQQIEEMQKQLLGFKLARQIRRANRNQKITSWWKKVGAVLYKPLSWVLSLFSKPKPVQPAELNTKENVTQDSKPQV